jgi:ferredoxin
MQGIGPVQVDLNQYNLESIDEILEEWKLTLRQKPAENAVNVELDCRNPEYFVDRVSVVLPRTTNGLGLELSELAGGRDDGLGITVVTGLVPEGPAALAQLDVQAGDVLTRVAIRRKQRRRQEQQQQQQPQPQQQGNGGERENDSDNSNSISNNSKNDSTTPTTAAVLDQEEVVQVSTEGLCYDATVQALASLPPIETNRYEEEMYHLTLKRIRRKPRVKINLQYPPSQKEKDTTIELFAGENLRMGMLLRGVKLNDPLAQRFDTKNGGNCGANGLCRTCSVTVQKGAELLNPQRLNEKQIFENAPRWRLACKAIVGYGMQQGEMTIRVNPNQFD